MSTQRIINTFSPSLQISVTSNIKLSRSKNVYTLEICEATVADSGKYTIKAKNQFGQCSATSSLNVLSKFPCMSTNTIKHTVSQCI